MTKKDGYRTDEEIVIQTNELAKKLSIHFGWEFPKDYFFYHHLEGMKSGREQSIWRAACMAQEIITQTNPEDALSGIDEEFTYTEVPLISVSINARSDEEIVSQTNKLAHIYLAEIGFEVPEDYLFYESNNPRGKAVWFAACVAQEILTQTDANDAVANCEPVPLVSEDLGPFDSLSDAQVNLSVDQEVVDQTNVLAVKIYNTLKRSTLKHVEDDFNMAGSDDLGHKAAWSASCDVQKSIRCIDPNDSLNRLNKASVGKKALGPGHL